MGLLSAVAETVRSIRTAAKDDDSRSILPKTVAIPIKGNSNRTIGAVAETLNSTKDGC